MRVIVVLVFFALVTACGSEKVCDFTSAVTCSVELKTGDALRVKFPPAKLVDPGPGILGVQYRWGVIGRLNQDLLQWGDDPDTKDHEYPMKAVGPGQTTVSWGELATGDPQAIISRTMEVTITGDPIDGAGTTAYLHNIAFVGGLGASVTSGSSLADLSLSPTDVFGHAGELFIVSEGRLWAIDRAANVGTIKLDTTLAGTAWPAGGTLSSLSPLDDGGYLALITLPASVSVVRIAAGLGSFTQVWSATSLQLRPGCTTCQDGLPVAAGRVRSNGDGTNWVASADAVYQIRNGVLFGQGAQGRTGHLVDASGAFVPANQDGTGLDHLGRVLFWASGGGASGATSLSMYSGGQATSVFVFHGKHGDKVARETDFMPFANGGAPVVGFADGTYWSHTFNPVVDGQGVTKTVPQGLFVHRP